MKKILFLLCMTLLFMHPESQSAPVTKPGLTISQGSVNVPVKKISNDRFMIMVRKSKDAPLTPVYARISHENEFYVGVGRHVDIVVRFYDDDANTIPASVSSLTVNYRVIGYDGSSMYDFNSSAVANGYDITLAYAIENDFQDGTTMRYRDYHLLDGDYIAQPL